MRIADGGDSGGPYIPPPPPPNAQDVSTAESALQNQLNGKSIDDAAALQAAINKVLQTQPGVTRDALARAAILMQAERNGAPKSDASPKVDTLQQAASQIGLTHVFDYQTLDDATHALSDKPLAVGGASPSGQGADPGAARAAIQAGLDDGMTLAEAVNAARVKLGGSAQNEVVLGTAALAIEGDKAMTDGTVPAADDPVKAVAAQKTMWVGVFSDATLDDAVKALTVEIKPGPDLKDAAKGAQTAFQAWQKDQASHADPAQLALDERAYHTALSKELNAAAGETDSHWRDGLLQIDQRWQAERAVVSLNTNGVDGAPRAADVATALHAAEIVDTADAARTSGGADGNLKSAQSLTQALQGRSKDDPLYQAVMGDARTQTLQGNALHDILNAGGGKNPHDRLVAIGQALSQYKGTALYDALADSTVHSGVTHDVIASVGTPDKLRDIANLLTDVQHASPELALALYRQNLQGKVDSEIKRGDPYAYSPPMGSLDQMDAYYGPIARIVQALGGPKSDGAKPVVQALQTYLQNGQNDLDRLKKAAVVTTQTPFDSLSLARANGAPMDVYQTLIDEDPNGELSKTLQDHTGLKPSPPPSTVKPENAPALLKAKTALDQALNGGPVNADTLRKALDDARKNNADIGDGTWAQAAVLEQANADTVQWQNANADKIKRGDAPKPDGDPIVKAQQEVGTDQLFTAQDLARGTQALVDGTLPVVPNTPDVAAAPSQTQAGQPGVTQYLQQLVASGMTMKEAIAVTRMWLGGNEKNEAMITQAALTVVAQQQYLAPYYQNPDTAKDPIDAAKDDLGALNVLDPDVLRVTAGQMKQDLQPDQKALDDAVGHARDDYRTWQDAKSKADNAKNDPALAKAAADALSKYHDDLKKALDAAAGNPADPNWQTDPGKVDTLWKAQYAVTMDGVAPELEAAREAGKDSPEFKQLQTVFQQWQQSLGAVDALQQVAHAQALGGGEGAGDVSAAKMLSGLMAGMGPGNPFYDEVMNDGAIAALRQRALAAVVGPDACATDPHARLADIGKHLSEYKGTLFYGQLLDGAIGAPQVRTLFTEIHAKVFDKKSASDQLGVLADQMDGLNPDLAAALYHDQFAGKIDDVSNLAALSRIYVSAGGAQNADMTALRQKVEGLMLKPVDKGGLGAESTDSRLNVDVLVGGDGMAIVMGQDFGLGDVKNKHVDMQLTQDIIGDNIAPDVTKEIERETGFKDSAKPAAPLAVAQDPAKVAAPDPAQGPGVTLPPVPAWQPGTTGYTAGGHLAGLNERDGMQTVTSRAQLLDIIGQAFNVQPTYTPGTLDQQQAATLGEFALYSGNEVVYDHKHQKTTIGQLADQLMQGEGVTQVSSLNPVSVTSLSMQWWNNREGTGNAQQLAILEGIGADGSTIDVGPADTTVRHGYDDWQSHSGLDKGLLVAQPHWVLDANGSLMSGDGYFTIYKPDDHWYDWDHLKTDLEIGATVLAGIATIAIQPETAALWAVMLSDLADAYFAVTAVTGTVQSVRALSTAQGRSNVWNWIGLGANVLGGAAGAGGVINRTAVAAARVGAADRTVTDALNAVRLAHGADAVTAARASVLSDGRWALRNFKDTRMQGALNRALFGTPEASARTADRLARIFSVTRNPGVVGDVALGTRRLSNLNDALPLVDRADLLSQLPARLRRLAGLRIAGKGGLAYRLLGAAAFDANLATMIHQGVELSSAGSQASPDDWLQFLTSAGMMGAGSGVARLHGAAHRSAHEQAVADLHASGELPGAILPHPAADSSGVPVLRVLPETGPRGADASLGSLDALLARVADAGGPLRMRDVYRLYRTTGAAAEQRGAIPASLYFPRIVDLAAQRPEGTYSASQDGVPIDGESASVPGADATFYHFQRHPDHMPQEEAGERIYIHAAGAHLPDIAEFLVRNVIDRPELFPGVETVKVAGPAAVGARADNVVLYATDTAAAERVLQALRHYQQAHPDHFNDTVPAMTEPQMRGVSTAAEPSPELHTRLTQTVAAFDENTVFGSGAVGRVDDPESFGSARAFAIAMASHDVAEMQLTRAGDPAFDAKAALREAVLRRFAEIGVDPANPARNLGSTDPANEARSPAVPAHAAPVAAVEPAVARPAGALDRGHVGWRRVAPDGRYRPSPFERVRMRTGGVEVPASALALASSSGTLASQMRLLDAAGWTIGVGRRGGGSHTDAANKHITLDGNAVDMGSFVYTLGHEAAHAVDAELGLLNLRANGNAIDVPNALHAEARAQGNAFNVRDEILAATGTDIGANAKAPVELERAYGEWQPHDPAAIERLAATMAGVPVSLPGRQAYGAYYAGLRTADASGIPDAMPASASGAPSHARQAAEWLDRHDLRTLDKAGGETLSDLHMLADRLSTGTHVLIAPKGVLDANGRPAFVATTQKASDGGFALPESVDPQHPLSADIAQALSADNHDEALAARSQYDFYVSPVSHDRLQQFGGVTHIKNVWTGGDRNPVPNLQVEPPHQTVIDTISKLAEPKMHKSVDAAEQAAQDSDLIYAIDRKTGELQGHAVKDPSTGQWTYKEEPPNSRVTIPDRPLRDAFPKRTAHDARTVRAARNVRATLGKVRFVVGDMPVDTVKELGGFQPGKPKDHDKAYEYKKLGVVAAARAAWGLHPVQGSAFIAREAGRKLPVGAKKPFVEYYGLDERGRAYARKWMLPEQGQAMDYAGVNVRHFRDLVDMRQLTQGEHHVYVYDNTANAGRKLGGRVTGRPKPIGRLDPQADGSLIWFDDWKADPAGPGGKPADQAPFAHGAAGPDVHFLVSAMTPKEFENAFGKRDFGERISVFQPTLVSTTIATVDSTQPQPIKGLFDDYGDIETVAGRKLDRKASDADLPEVVEGVPPDVVVADASMWQKLKLKLGMARDVGANTVSRRFPFRPQRYSAAAMGDSRMVAHLLDSVTTLDEKQQAQLLRLAPMARAHQLRDDTDAAREFIEETGAAQPIIALVVDPYSLRAAAGKRQHPNLVKDATKLDAETMRVNYRDGRIESGPEGAPDAVVALDDLSYENLQKWLKLSSETGVILRFEFAPMRPSIGEDGYFTARSSNAYHEYERMFSMFEKWGSAPENDGKPAPNVLVSFHGGDVLLEPVPGSGHATLVDSVLKRQSLPWVHMSVSYATNGADSIANEELTSAVARLVLKSDANPATQGRLHGDDPLTRVFNRPSKSDYEAQLQPLLAEIVRQGRAGGKSDDEIKEIVMRVFRGNTTALVNRARGAQINYAERFWEQNTRANDVPKLQPGAETFAALWKQYIGSTVPDERVKIDATAARDAANDAKPWNQVVEDSVLNNVSTRESAGRQLTTQNYSPGNLTENEKAKAELTALGVKPPEWGKSERAKKRLSLLAAAAAGGGTFLLGVAYTHEGALKHPSGAKGLLELYGKNYSTLNVGARLGRWFQVVHQASIKTVQDGDPRVFVRASDVLVKRLERELPKFRAKDDESGEQTNQAIDQLRQFKDEAQWSMYVIQQRLARKQITADDAATQAKRVAADMVTQIEGVFGGIPLSQIHPGHPHRFIGWAGRFTSLAASGTSIGVNTELLWSHPFGWSAAITYGLPIATASLSGAYTSAVLFARGRNVEQRSRFVRGVSAWGDVTSVAGGMWGGSIKLFSGDWVGGSTTIVASAALGASRVTSHLPNASTRLGNFGITISSLPMGTFVIQTEESVQKQLEK
ncbi:T3SS effector HopA1 family protein [Burkholderia sp. MR1-5-21]